MAGKLSQAGWAASRKQVVNTSVAIKAKRPRGHRFETSMLFADLPLTLRTNAGENQVIERQQVRSQSLSSKILNDLTGFGEESG